MAQPTSARIYDYKTGLSLIARIYGGICGTSEFNATAQHLVDTLSKDELRDFIADMLCAVEMIKMHERTVNGFDLAKQFGIKFVNE